MTKYGKRRYRDRRINVTYIPLKQDQEAPLETEEKPCRRTVDPQLQRGTMRLLCRSTLCDVWVSRPKGPIKK